MMEKIFNEEIKKKADAIVARYEQKRAALLEILHLIMEKRGYISLAAEEAVAEYMGLPAIAVREVVSFYTLYYTKPKAKHRFNVCRTLSCSLLNGEGVLKHLEEKLGVKAGETSKDGQCSIQTVECLGACEIAPMLQYNDDEYLGGLTPEKIDEIIQSKVKSWKD